MADVQNLADQLGWCNTTRDYLESLTEQLRTINKTYELTVDDFTAKGYFSDLREDLGLDEMQQEFTDMTNNLIRYIEDEHIDYIDDESKIVLDALGKFGY